MDVKKIFEIGKYRAELTVHNASEDLKSSSDNNIDAFDKNGLLLWNIAKLLKAYSDKNGFKYYSDVYFDIRLLDNEKIYCVGFYNHCEIDLKSGVITKIVNNR